MPFLCVQVRQSAGLLLKNNLKQHYAGATDELRRYIKVTTPPIIAAMKVLLEGAALSTF